MIFDTDDRVQIPTFKQNTLDFIEGISHTPNPIQEINTQADIIGVSQDVWLS